LAQNTNTENKTKEKEQLSYVGVKMSYKSFYGGGDKINLDSKLFTTIDFTKNVYKWFNLGGLINISDYGKIAKYSLNIGIKNIGISLESGNLNGNINDYDIYTKNTNTAKFEGDFNLLAIYRHKLSGTNRLGFAILNFEMPTDVYVNYSYALDLQKNTIHEGLYTTVQEESYNYIDINTKYSLYGLYFSVDVLHSAVESGNIFSNKKNGLYFFPTLVAGIATRTFSDYNNINVESFLKGDLELNNDMAVRLNPNLKLVENTKSWGVGMDTRMEIGYHITGDITSKSKYGIAFGLELGQNITFFFDDETFPDHTSTEYTKHGDGTFFGSYGPFVRGIIHW